MMSSLATRFKSTALKLLTNYGDVISCVQYTQSGNYQVSLGNSPVAETAYTILGVSESYKPFEINEQTIRATDVKLTCYSASVRPLVGDKVTFNNNDYRIQSVENIYLQSIDIVYTLQLRK